MDKRNIKLLLALGPIGALFFTVSFTVQGLSRNGYDPLRHPVSSLAIGPSGWIQVYSFVIAGLLFVFFSLGIREVFPQGKYRRSITAFVLATGIGLAGAGVFSTDPVYGYPTQLPLHLAQFTWQGHLHDLFSLIVFISITGAAINGWRYFVITGQKGISVFSLLSAITILLTFILAGIGFKQAPVFVDFAGLLQRASIIGGCAWLAVFGIYLNRNMIRVKNDTL
jgi:hypothetical protein